MSFDFQWAQDDSKVGRFSVSHRGMMVLKQALSVMEVLVEKDPPNLTEQSTEEEIHEGLAYRAKTPGKVPKPKLESNDGWLLVPDECAAMAHAIGNLLDDPFKWTAFNSTIHRSKDPQDTPEADRQFLQRFIAYATRCAAVGGFRVL
jgi:hypothetical protein